MKKSKPTGKRQKEIYFRFITTFGGGEGMPVKVTILRTRDTMPCLYRDLVRI